MPEKKVQLIIRDAGLGSRRSADQMIREGRVTVNGRVIDDPAVTADPGRDHIKVDGKLMRFTPAAPQYYLFNKPRHVVSTMDDPEGRPCVGDYVKQLKTHLFSIGRLDFDAEGLMILTNDGMLAQRLSHPSGKIPRTYLVKVKGTPDPASLSMIRKGLSLGEGERVGEVQWALLKSQQTTTWIKLVLYEGKKNEIKRIFFRIGHPVRKLRRVSFGPLTLGKLPSGMWRALTPAEMEELAAFLEQ